MGSSNLFWWTRNFIQRENKLQWQTSLTLNNINKSRGLLPTSKESKNLQAKDHFAKEWGAILHNLGTQQTETLEEDVKRIQESSQMDLILQGGVASISKRRLEQTWESDSMIITSNFKLATKVRAHLIVLASTWRGRMVFTLLEQAKTSSPL